MRSNSIILVALTVCQSIFSVPMEETALSLDRRTFGLDKVLAAKFAAKKKFIKVLLGKTRERDDYVSNPKCQSGTEDVCASVCGRNPNAPGCKIYNCTLDSSTSDCKTVVCKTYPFAPGCSTDNGNYKCKNNPSAPGCQEDYCESNPNSPGCYTGSVEKPTKPVSPPIYNPTNNDKSSKYD